MRAAFYQYMSGVGPSLGSEGLVAIIHPFLDRMMTGPEDTGERGWGGWGCKECMYTAPVRSDSSCWLYGGCSTLQYSTETAIASMCLPATRLKLGCWQGPGHRHQSCALALSARCCCSGGGGCVLPGACVLPGPAAQALPAHGGGQGTAAATAAGEALLPACLLSLVGTWRV